MKHVVSVTTQRPAQAMMGLGGFKGNMWQWMDEDMWDWMAEYVDVQKGNPTT